MQKILHIQSAMEFLTTYSWAFLLIAVMLSVLFMIAFIPKTIISNSCNFYSGFYCYDSVLSNTYSPTNTPTGSELKVLLSDTQVGTISISSFNAILGNSNSFNSLCTNSTLHQGSKTLCTATFNSIINRGVIEMGSLYIRGNYCAGAISSLSTGSCSSNGNYVVIGAIRIQSQ